MQFPKIYAFTIVFYLIITCLIPKALANDIVGWSIKQQNRWYGLQEFSITKDKIRIDNSFGHTIISNNDKLVTIYNDNSKCITRQTPETVVNFMQRRNKIPTTNIHNFKKLGSKNDHGYKLVRYSYSATKGKYNLDSYIDVITNIELSASVMQMVDKILLCTVPGFPSKQISIFKYANGSQSKPLTHYFTTAIKQCNLNPNLFAIPQNYKQVSSITQLIFDDTETQSLTTGVSQ